MTEQQLSHCEAVSGPTETADLWRNEVQDRLARYKRRRGRRIEGAYTMRFPFPVEDTAEVGPFADESPVSAQLPEVTAENRPLALAEAADILDADPNLDPAVADATATTVADEEAAPENADAVLEAPAAAEEEAALFVDVIERPRPKRKVIAFPKQFSAVPEVVHRLADPVTAEAPRILDVPEELEAIPATPFLDGLQLDLPDPAVAASSREHVELPFQAVTISRRVLAGAVDLGIVLVATGFSAVVAYKILADPQLTKPLVFGLLAGTVVLWTAYQYLFVVHAGKTVGMMAARIRLRTFKGKSASIRQRRHRVLGLYLSSLSLGMGLMWALVDVDSLCWHDRLSKTFLAARG